MGTLCGQNVIVYVTPVVLPLAAIKCSHTVVLYILSFHLKLLLTATQPH